MLKDLFEKIREHSPFLGKEALPADNLVGVEKSHPPSPESENTEPAAPQVPVKPPEPSSLFTVYVDDNFHYMDKDHRYTAEELDTWEEALALARKIVDETIVKAIEGGSRPEEAIDEYRAFGEDPWISEDGTVPCDESFSAWFYAETRARELYELKQLPQKTGRPRRVGRPIGKSTLTAKEAPEDINRNGKKSY